MRGHKAYSISLHDHTMQQFPLLAPWLTLRDANYWSSDERERAR